VLDLGISAIFKFPIKGDVLGSLLSCGLFLEENAGLCDLERPLSWMMEAAFSRLFCR
jgi:hypothetical protein